MPKKKRKVMTEEVRQFLNNKSQTYFDGRFNSGAFFIYLTVRPSTDGKRAPLTAINLQAAGSPQQAPPTYIAKTWKLIKFRKNVIFSRNHTDVNPDDWTITKKTIRTTIHENFSKMKNLKVDRWALSLKRTNLKFPSNLPGANELIKPSRKVDMVTCHLSSFVSPHDT